MSTVKIDKSSQTLRKYDLTGTVKVKVIDNPTHIEEQIESNALWSRSAHIEPVPHLGVAYPKAIEADFRINNGVLALDLRAPLVEYAVRRWSVDCSTKHSLDPKEHHLWLEICKLFTRWRALLLPPDTTIQLTQSE